MKTKILYVEQVSWRGDIRGDQYDCPARIGRVRLSKSGRTLYYAGLVLRRTTGYKYNHYDTETGEQYWVSGCHKNGNDPLYPKTVFIDADVQGDYWTDIRNNPECVGQISFKSDGKYQKGQQGRDRLFVFSKRYRLSRE